MRRMNWRSVTSSAASGIMLHRPICNSRMSWWRARSMSSTSSPSARSRPKPGRPVLATSGTAAVPRVESLADEVDHLLLAFELLNARGVDGDAVALGESLVARNAPGDETRKDPAHEVVRLDLLH